MLNFLVFLGIVCLLQNGCRSEDDDEFGGDLISSLTADRNLDLPVDEEYEDLRAELLAYHTVLANMVPGGAGSLFGDKNDKKKGDKKEEKKKEEKTALEKSGRRTLSITPCWKQGGICILKDLCIGPRFMTEVPGCKDKVHVCCFGWNRYYVKDFNPLFKEREQYGPSANTLAIIEGEKKRKAKKSKNKKKKKHSRKSFAIIIRNKSDK